MFRMNWLIRVAMVVAIAGTANATVWLVPTLAHMTIQDAIDDPAVDDGDTISVWGDGQPPFTYDAINYDGKGLFIVNRSYVENMPGYPPNPFWVQIDGDNSSSAVTITGVSSGATATLEGFTVFHGSSSNGAGICCLGNTVQSKVVIRNDSIADNWAANSGGGVYFYEHYAAMSFVIDGCIISGNHAIDSAGGGVCALHEAEVSCT